MGARRPAFRGQRWAIFALLTMAALWTWRWVEHDDALRLVGREYFDGAAKLRVFASPYPGNPYQWHAVVETPTTFRRRRWIPGAAR